jgi:cyclase
MSSPLSRRHAIRLGAGAGLGLLSALGGDLDSRVSAQGLPATIPPAPNPNFPRVPAWNIVVGDESVMVIDTLTAPIHAKNFIAAIRKVTDKPFRHVINTHHHPDHVNGNQYFTPAEIVAHPYCRDEVLKMAPGPALWPKRDGWADGTEERKIVPAVTTFENKMTCHYGGNVVELIFMGPAHTWGDIVVHLPQHKILFAGDIAFHYVAPFAQNAHVTKWLETIDRIMKMDVETIVPGHGPIGGKHELAEMGEYFVVLKREARKRFDAGMSPGRAAADIRMGKFDNWIGPERIVMDTVRLYAEFSGSLVPSVDVEGNRTATEEYNAIKAAMR